MNLETLMSIFGSIAVVFAIKWLCDISSAKIDPMDRVGFKNQNLITNFEETHSVLKRMSERIYYNRRANFAGFFVLISSIAFLITFIIYRTGGV